MPSTTSVCCCVTDRKDTAGTSSVSCGCCTSALGALAFCIAKGLPSTTPYLLSSPSSVSSHPSCLGNVSQSLGGSTFPFFFSCCCSHAVILTTLHLQIPDRVLGRFSWEAIATSVTITPSSLLFLPFGCSF